MLLADIRNKPVAMDIAARKLASLAGIDRFLSSWIPARAKGIMGASQASRNTIDTQKDTPVPVWSDVTTAESSG